MGFRNPESRLRRLYGPPGSPQLRQTVPRFDGSSGVFDLVVDIMGPYVLHSMSQAIVRTSGNEFPGYTHTDGGEALRRIRVTETSRPLAMKAMYLLSDVNASDSGNFTVYPGSHMRPFPEDPASCPHPHGPGAVQLQGKAGDCYLFPIRYGTAPRPITRGIRARRCYITTVKCSFAGTTSKSPRKRKNSAPRVNNGYWRPRLRLPPGFVFLRAPRPS